MTQKQLASAASLSPAEICAIEKRMRSPQTDTIQEIAAALDVSVSLLLGEFYSDLPLGKALTRDSFNIFVQREKLTDEQERILRGIINTDSAPQTVKGWRELIQNLGAFENLKGQSAESRIFDHAPQRNE